MSILRLDRYIIRGIVGPLALTGMVLIVLFGSYSAARFLADAVSEQLPTGQVIFLVLLRILIALEVLLPVALYLSVVAGLGRLYADAEVLAMEAAGINPARLLRNVFLLAATVALLVAGLSLLIRPWAYRESYRIKTAAQADFDLSRLKAGRFYPLDGTVLFFQEIDPAQLRATGIFIRRVKNGVQEVSWAREGFQMTAADKSKTFFLVDGRHYRLDSDRNEPGRIVRFNQYSFSFQPEAPSPEYQRKAAPTRHLARSALPEDIAEFQWRLSTALSTVLLGVLGVPLSRSAPRKGRNARLFTAVVIFALYYNLALMAKKWVENGTVGAFPGIWWAPAALAALLMLLLGSPAESFLFRRRPRTGGG